MSKPRLIWRREPHESGLRGVAQGERGYELRCQGETLGSVGPMYIGFSRKKSGYYCSGSWDARGVPLINTCATPVATVEEAKEILMAHFREHLKDD